MGARPGAPRYDQLRLHFGRGDPERHGRHHRRRRRDLGLRGGGLRAAGELERRLRGQRGPAPALCRRRGRQLPGAGGPAPGAGHGHLRLHVQHAHLIGRAVPFGARASLRGRGRGERERPGPVPRGVRLRQGPFWDDRGIRLGELRLPTAVPRYVRAARPAVVFVKRFFECIGCVTCSRTNSITHSGTYSGTDSSTRDTHSVTHTSSHSAVPQITGPSNELLRGCQRRRFD
mmetsp:Transcript_82460/g.233381  ORF Transcript_82460/g.233381 Transcript_82460/m.233381 type:complete len:231 (+) Transcript_82460:1640-2332(+)